MGIIVAIAFGLILICLGAAGVFMLKGGRAEDNPTAKNGQNKPNSPHSLNNPSSPNSSMSRDLHKNKRMAQALGLRVFFSICIFVSLLLAWYLGLIQPTGLR